MPRARAFQTAGGWPLLLPALLFLGFFFVMPILVMVGESLSEGPATYAEVLTSSTYTRVFGNTVYTSVVTTACCLVLAYPYAYVINRAGPRVRTVLIALVLMPFWVSLLTRTFAWVGLLQDTGVINSLLLRAGIISEPLQLIRTEAGTLIGMVQVLLPFMVLPLINTMAGIDPSQLRAARSLGASPWQRFVRVFLPLSMPGVMAGAVLVLVMALGFYITPAMLGSPAQMMVGELLIQETQKVGTVRASAIGIVLLAGTLVSLAAIAALRSLATRKERAA